MTSQTDKAFMDYQAQIIKELKEELSELKDEKGIEPPTKHNVYNKIESFSFYVSLNMIQFLM